MKRARKHPDEDLEPEYDFAGMADGVRGKYGERLGAGSNIAVLDDDVAAAFPTDAAVNEALRAVLLAAAVIRGAKDHQEPMASTDTAGG